MKNSKKIGFILGLIMFILLLVGGTFAFWIWRGTFARVAVTANVPFNCAADGGVHDSTNKLMPAACTHERYAIKREITVDYSLFSPDSSVYMDMILTIDSIDQGLLESANFKYALTTSDNSCTSDVITSGTFANKRAGTKIKLLDKEVYSQLGMDIVNKFYLYIWIDAKEENRNILNQYFEFSLSLECTQGQKVIKGAELLVSKANNASITSYEDGNKGEMYTFSQPETEQLSATTDYRYIGNIPNNYITFNDETWRIIGVFDGKIKIIKDTPIGNMALDYKKTGVGSATGNFGSNDWVDSQTMYMLNPNDIATNVALKTGYTYDGTYVKDANDKIIYQKGCKPTSTDGTSYSCSAISWSLNENALSQVVDSTYYLGGVNSTSVAISVLNFYEMERSTNKYNDVRSIDWSGKVGLMYPSDYGYTVAYGINDDCYDNLSQCTSISSDDTWLYFNNYRWFISVNYSGSQFGLRTDSDSNKVVTYAVYWNGGYIQPVVYLKSNTLLNGTGTSGDPYVITDIDDYVPPVVEEPEVNATDGALMLINKANGSSVTTYESGNKGEMYTFSQPATEQLSATTDYRYIGSSPNNYITFNNETWRIIGVFDGRIKIIKDTQIGTSNIPFDYKKTGIGSSTSDSGSNDWVDAQLMYFLNPNDIATNVALKSGYTFDGTYVKDANGKIIYQKGCNPSSTDGTSYSCTTNSWALNSTALSQIEDVTYYLGGSSTYNGHSASSYYTFERGETKFNDVRSTNWTGKVGLMYPSDYAYTFAYGVDDVCYNDGYNCKTASSAVPSSSWLYISSNYQWTLAPYSSYAYRVFRVYSTGYVSSNDASNTYVVRPVVYLKSDISLTGTGTSGDPYRIVQSEPPVEEPEVNATDGALMLINKANGSSVTTYNNGIKGEMYTFSQPATEQLSATTDYRYIGNSPNNYITFNNESWRIIGVFDGRIKIIKDTQIGTSSIPFDYKKTGIGSSTSDSGSNDWVDAQLMYFLNPNDIATNVALKSGYTFDGTYVKDSNGKIIYQKGCNPASTDGASYSCTTNSWSLNSTALSQIADVTYYLGGIGYNSTTHYGTTPEIYTWERGDAKYNNVRSTNWTGKVGLMYPSDYGYTFAYGVDDVCYNDGFNCQTANSAVPSSSWLYISSHGQWTLAPYFSNASHVFNVYSTGYVYNSVASSTRGVRPVVYLKSDITLTGTGTSGDPYVIVQSEPPVEEPEVNATDGALMLINKANGSSVTTYNNGNKGEMYTFSQPATEQLSATTDYRYIGNSPNNYITFNNETWRIIGVFDGRIKIIKDTRIGTSNIRWDYKQSGVGSSTLSYGSNDWIDSQLMYMLNPNDIATNVALKTGYTYDGTYVKDANGKIIYQKGCNPASTDGTSYSCTTNSWSLNSTALSQVADVTYYLGGTSAYTSLSTSGFYGIERGETKYNDVRSTNWTGKVGLMYPSDYAYTFAYGVGDTCYSNPYNCNTSTPSSSWLYTSSYKQWTLSPHSSGAGYVFNVYSGSVNSSNANITYGVRPVVYLKSDIKLTGTGTSDDPYVIG